MGGGRFRDHPRFPPPAGGDHAPSRAPNAVRSLRISRTRGGAVLRRGGRSGVRTWELAAGRQAAYRRQALMRLPRSLRNRLVALLGVAALVAVTGPAGAADPPPKTVKVVGQFSVFVKKEGAGCRANPYVGFLKARGATQYRIVVLDNGRESTYFAPRFDELEPGSPPADSEYAVKVLAGTNSSEGDCSGAAEGYRARFKLVRVEATVIPKPGRIAGRVTSKGRPVRGMRVEAYNPPGYHAGRPNRFAAVTGRNGRYSIAVPYSKLGYYHVHPDSFRYVPSRAGDVPSGGALFADFLDEATWLNGFKPGPPSNAVGSVTEIVALDPSRPARLEVLRDGRWQPLGVAGDVESTERVRTDGNTRAAIELDLGGRIALRQGSEVEVFGRRALDRSGKSEGFRLTKGGVWAKCGQMKESLEIQTTGGVMGIKG